MLRKIVVIIARFRPAEKPRARDDETAVNCQDGALRRKARPYSGGKKSGP